MNYLIGGSARCGKSTLSRTVRQTTSAQSLSGDAFRDALRKSTAFGTIPELHQPRAEKIPEEQAFIDYHTRQAQEEIAKKRSQALLMWGFLESYLITTSREGESAVVDSIDIWPDLLAASSLHHVAVFLIDTSTQQWERIAATRGQDTTDWMHANGYSDARIQAWSTFNAHRSERIAKLCDQHGYPYVDLAETGFEEGQRVALKELVTQPARNNHAQGDPS